jgi:hypothetical protein
MALSGLVHEGLVHEELQRQTRSLWENVVAIPRPQSPPSGPNRGTTLPRGLERSFVKRPVPQPFPNIPLSVQFPAAPMGWSGKCAAGRPSNKEQCERVPGDPPGRHQSKRRYREKIAASALTVVYSAAALYLFAFKLAVIQQQNPALFDATARFEKPLTERTKCPFAPGDLSLDRLRDTRAAERR